MKLETGKCDTLHKSEADRGIYEIATLVLSYI